MMDDETPAKNTAIITRRRVIGATVIGIAIGAAGWRFFREPAVYEGNSLSVTQAHQMALSGGVFLIDIRRPDEWRLTGIGEGAHPIDMRSKDFIETLTSIVGQDKTVPIALICARGVRSARLSNRLSQAGYTNIIDVPEGMLGSRAGPGWLNEKLPTRPFAKGS